MPYAKNPLDGLRVHFEDDEGSGAPVVFLGGFLDSVPTMRESDLARALTDEFRLIYVDQRGLGRSDKPHAPGSYAMPLRVADPIAVLDELGIERAHFVGLSWGGRLCFGIGERAPARVRALVVGGQQPYAWPDSPLSRLLVEALAAAQTRGMDALIEAMERFWDIRFPAPLRARYLDNDPAALQAAATWVLAEGPVSEDLHAWAIPCLIFLGAGDTDFVDLARRAAGEIPGAEFVSLAGQDHISAHTDQGDVVVEAVKTLLRAT